MSHRPRVYTFVVSALMVALIAAFAPTATQTDAQVGGGATLTVLRGTVGVLQGGQPIQPARSGLTLGVGDQIATLDNSGALVTFFEGSEVELGANTTIVLRELTRQGARANVRLENVIGTTVHRVIAFSDPGSSYRVESGGAVAAVRGTTFAIHTDQNGNVTAAVETCAPRPRDACLEFPSAGRLLGQGQKATHTDRGDLFEDSFSSNTNIWDAVTTPASSTRQGTENQGANTGSRTVSQATSQQPDDDDDVQHGPTGTPGDLAPCGVTTVAGGAGVTTNSHNMGTNRGTFNFSWEAFGVPDQFEVFYQGNRIFDTGSVSGGSSHTISFGPGTDTFVTVRVTGPSGTAWEYTVDCPS